MVEGISIQSRESVAASSKEKLTAVVLGVGCAREQGYVRKHQEDAYFVPRFPQEDPYFFVADGAGGHTAGDIAAQLAVASFAQAEKQSPSNQTNRQLLEHLFNQANSAIYFKRKASNNNMLTTGVALALEETENGKIVATIANVGDSRAYLLGKRSLRQLTTDHSWVQEQIAQGSLTEEQARRSQHRNIITRALGDKPSVEVDITQVSVPLRKDKDVVFLLCTDGLSGYVPEKQIQSILKKVADGKLSPQQAAEQLTQAANRQGGYDNSTAVVVKLAKKTPPSKHRRLQKIKDAFLKRRIAQPESMERVAAPKPTRPIESAQTPLPDPITTSTKQPQAEAFKYGNWTIEQMGQQGLFDLFPANNTEIDSTGRVVVDLSPHYNGTVLVKVPFPVLQEAYQKWKATKETSGDNVVRIPVFYGGQWYGGGINKTVLEQILNTNSENR